MNNYCASPEEIECLVHKCVPPAGTELVDSLTVSIDGVYLIFMHKH